MQLDGSGSANSVTVSPVGSKACVVYQAPTDLKEEIPLGVTAVNSVGTVIANGTINLRHPPVVFVHGIWSSPIAFKDWENLIRLIGYAVSQADYSANSADTFNPFDESVPISKLVSAVEGALNISRGRGIAASQVDVVAHSMGGLVARAREKDPRFAFRRKENRNQGEFHKLITIGTPHEGSPLADWLWARRDCSRGITVQFPRMGYPIGRAIDDFQTTSHTLFLLNGTGVPTRAIAGRKPAALIPTPTENTLNTVLKYGYPFVTIDSILRTHGEDDVIVPLYSQMGGLRDGTTATIVDGVIHAEFSLIPKINPDAGITETSSPEVLDRVLTALTAPRADAFGSIPVFQPSVQEQESSPCPGLGFAAAAGGGPTITSLMSPRSAAATGEVATITPVQGTVVRPGEAIQVAFFVPVSAGSTSAMISIGGQMTFVTGSAGSFSTTYQLPAAVIGRVPVSATTLDLGDGNLSASTYVVALPSTPPAGLAPSPGSVGFAVTGQTAALTVLGTYGDGATADLTSSASGTTYSTLSGTNSVINVSAEGVVQAVANGQDTVVIQNGGQTASVTATVNITNQPPTLAALADTSVVAGQTLNIPLTASDPDGNTVQLSGTGLPSFVTLVDNHNGTGVLSVHPSATDVGTYPIFISVVDDGNPALGLSRSLQLTVGTASDSKIPGDLNGDGVVTMADAIIALQVMARIQPSGLRSDYTTSGVDVNGDSKVGMPELIYILQKAAGAR
ncbi:MAG: dockerin type I domain-containing protein [Deltaproteobacteria bacterium]